MLTTALPSEELAAYVAAQLSSMFPDRRVQSGRLTRGVSQSLERLEFCFDRSSAKYTAQPGEEGQSRSHFDHRNTDQYASFLYFLSNTLYRLGGEELAAKTYALNKALHGVDIFYEVELPRIFHLQHPVGSVLGRARYADYFVCYQRVSVGSNLEGESPEFGCGVVLFGGSGVIGNCRIASNVWVSVNTLVMDAIVESDTAVFGQSPAIVKKPARRNVREHFFREAAISESAGGAA